MHLPGMQSKLMLNDLRQLLSKGGAVALLTLLDRAVQVGSQSIKHVRSHHGFHSALPPLLVNVTASCSLKGVLP
jgi:hypothetical protein